MNILDTIIAAKHQEVAQKKLVSSESALRVMEHFRRPCLSLKDSLLKPGATGIIAEFKRKSPSKGLINAGADVASITASYTAFGASGLS
ncbi:MAG: indole-3-glycerol-phosphate synthase TrpC, partial [Chitinophagaceae bacterium]